MPDVPPHTPGYCATTVDGESDCTAGAKGALGLHHSETLSLRAATHACLRKCDACARCRYITVSPRHADCSWYAECDLNRLSTDVPGLVSMEATEYARSWARVAPLSHHERPADAVTYVARASASRPPGAFVSPEWSSSQRIALVHSADKALGPWPPPAAELLQPTSWTSGAPCARGWTAASELVTRLTLGNNLAFARRHGHDLIVAKFRGTGRHPTWFKLCAVLGLLESSSAGRRPYDWIMALDLDASLSAAVGVDAWLRATLGGAPPPCLVVGLDGEQEGVANTGVMLMRNDRRSKALLRAWWAWPLEGEDGAASWRHKWDYGLYHEQSVLNAGILPNTSCAHIRPAGDFYVAPGTVARHFTGMCPLAPPYDAEPEPENSSPHRKCKCWLSHFGPRHAATLLREERVGEGEAEVCERWAHDVSVTEVTVAVEYARYCGSRRNASH